jgi:predicted GH43/DUF377 family glycosyl hydrolase
MLEWTKLGRVFDPAKVSHIPWMANFAQAPAVLVLDNVVRVYFSCRPAADTNGQFSSYLAYADFKRDNLLELVDFSKQPILPLGEKGTFDEFGTNPPSAIRMGTEVWIYYAGLTRCESVPFNAAIGLAVSRDGGRTFARLGNGPVLSYSVDEPFVLGSPRIRRFNNTLYLWYCAGKKWIRTGGRPEPVYKIRLAVSNNGVDWKKQGRDLLESALEEDECQASAEVFALAGRYHMLFSYRHTVGFKDDQKRGYRIGYAWSDDLENWTRDDGQAGVQISDEGWDSGSVSYPNVFELDGNVYMYYQGNEIGRSGFGLARLSHFRSS